MLVTLIQCVKNSCFFLAHKVTFYTCNALISVTVVIDTYFICT
jgi:hypothetical protein